MQDLIVGEVYNATLNSDYFRNEKSVLKYIGKHPEWDFAFQFVVMEKKVWPKPLLDDALLPEGDHVWDVGKLLDLGIDNYTFEPYNIVLENE